MQVFGSGMNNVIRSDVWLEFNDVTLTDPPVAKLTETWTTTANVIDWTIERMFIYARVTWQERPINNLTITAHLVGDDSSQQQNQVASLRLMDGGTADVTQGDGIYSAVVTQWPLRSTTFAYVVTITLGQGTIDSGISEFICQ